MDEADEDAPLSDQEQVEDVGIESVSEAVEESERKFKQTLVFTKKAHDSADESPYGQPDKVYRALEAMDEVCRLRRQAKKDKKSLGPLEQTFADRGFTYKAKESRTSKGKWIDEYEMAYDGKKVSIEQHLALGKGGPETCLRIHFWVDEKREQFVIDHVGRHKTNTKT